MKSKSFLFYSLPLMVLAVFMSWAGEITPAGLHLADALDAMHVDQLWLAGRQVDWRSGKPNGKIYAVPNGHTHCSAFAAAAAEQLGIYLLHPPEHSSILLANAQQDWLSTKGTNFGWTAVDSPLQAQRLANEGELVVVTCKNPDSKLPGHIAIVRPSARDDASILSEGPEIIQAGLHNYIHATTREGFKNHPGAFEKRELLYFCHAIPDSPPRTGSDAHSVTAQK
jgi:hypothetical protein